MFGFVKLVVALSFVVTLGRSLSYTACFSRLTLLPILKGTKFFLQFQIARVRTAQGAKLGVADTVEHQLGKVLKNAVGATQAEKDAVTALSKQL
ncbi:hypothetical protein RSAG8_03929, partial [Rhizoctonia solani AG-8 WAC10335]